MPAALRSRTIARVAILGAVGALLAAGGAALACPFCGSVKSTLTQEIKSSDVAVIARMTAMPTTPDTKPGELNIAPPIAKFDIVDVVKGQDVLKQENIHEFEAPFFADNPTVGAKYLFEGTLQPPQGMIWSPPVALTQRSHQYLLDLSKYREGDPARLVFLMDYLGDSEQLLSGDSYDEFALAPYAALKAIKDKMPHDTLVKRIQDPEETASRRRLYLTMLGICGSQNDLPMLEKLLASKDPKFKTGLDATIACYLVLKGADGLPLVEKLFLEKDTDEYTDIFAVVMALRTLGQEKDIIPQDKLVAAMEKVLDHPKVADQAIMDLARWEDWRVMDRLVEMFKSNDPEVVSWVRVPVISYLRVCPLPKAKQYVEELRKIDPKAVKQSETLYAVGPDVSAPATADNSASGSTGSATNSGSATDATPQADKGATSAPAPADPATAKRQSSDNIAPTATPVAAESSKGTDAVAGKSAATSSSFGSTAQWTVCIAAAVVCAMVISMVSRTRH